MMGNSGNPMGMIMNLIAQGRNNPQMFVNGLLQKNPNFAKSLQGQNPKQLAMQELNKRGIDPNIFLQMFNNGGK